MRKGARIRAIILCLALGVSVIVDTYAQHDISDIEKQKKSAEKEIRETRNELNANEWRVNESLTALRKIDDDIAVSQRELETVSGQLEKINKEIEDLEKSISENETELNALRQEYLKAVKKMRVARKKNSSLAFIFASASFNEARRRMRYMKELSEWKERRSAEITGKVKLLQKQKGTLSRAQNNATVAVNRQKTTQQKLSQQKQQQTETVAELRANSETLKAKLAKRQAEVRQLSNQISAIIAEERAKEAREEAARKKAEEEKRIAAEKKAAEEKRIAAEKKAEEEKRIAAEKKAAEEKRIAAERKAAEEKIAQESKKKAEEKQVTENKSKPEKNPAPEKKPTVAEKGSGEYAEARKRQPRTANETEKKETVPAVQKPEQTASSSTTSSGSFESMKGKLPRPVSGSWKVVSAFGVHPISPELPDITEENLGIDVHVGAGATVTSVFDGEVIKIIDRTAIPGLRNVVLVKHGEYTTVYANLETLSVKSGQKVKQGQSLGSVGTDFDEPSVGRLHFEVWKNQSRQNPALWIK